MVFEPASSTARLNATTNFTIHYSAVSAFSISPVGKVLTITMNFVRDMLLMIVEIMLNLLSVVLLRRHLRKKSKLTNKRGSVFATAFISTTGYNGVKYINPQNQYERSVQKMSSSDRKVTVMVCLMCCLSIMTHLIVLIASIFPYFEFSLTTFILYFMGNFSFPLKCFFDFFFFFAFNNNFRAVVLRYLRIKTVNRVQMQQNELASFQTK
jgi:hypothetical protein